MEFTKKGIHNKHNFINNGKFNCEINDFFLPVLCRIPILTLLVILVVNISNMECCLFWNITMIDGKI